MPARRDSDGLVCQAGLHPLEGRERRGCRECATARARERRARGGAAPRLGMFVPPLWVGDVSWMDRALCRGMDPELWFAADRSPEARRARTICFGCPVQGECFQWAMAVEGTESLNYRHGIYGGFGARFRADLARKRAARTKTGAVS